MITVNGVVLERFDTSANWDYVNPVLPVGQLGWEFYNDGVTPLGVKMGDGVTAWDSLPYWFKSATLPIITKITADVTPNPISAYYGSISNPTLLFRNLDGSTYAGAANSVDNAYAGSPSNSITLTGDESPSVAGTFADTFWFIMKA